MSKLFAIFLVLQLFLFPTAACSAQEGGARNDESPSNKTARPSSTIKIGQVVRDCADCPEMVAVPQVGRAASNPGKIFYAGRTEITWRQYLVAVREGSCPVPQKDFGDAYNVYDPKINDDYPLTGISPDIFPCYIDWLRKKSGRIYRIPSASEWEHVARAGTKTKYYWGDDLGFNNAMVFDYFDKKALEERLGGVAGSFRNDPRGDVKWKTIYPVGLFKSNPWGLYDVIGNVAEITTESFAPLPACVKNQPLRVCEVISARGSDIVRSPNPITPNPPITESLSTTRYRTTAHHGNHRVGFRLVRP